MTNNKAHLKIILDARWLVAVASNQKMYSKVEKPRNNLFLMLVLGDLNFRILEVVNALGNVKLDVAVNIRKMDKFIVTLDILPVDADRKYAMTHQSENLIGVYLQSDSSCLLIQIQSNLAKARDLMRGLDVTEVFEESCHGPLKSHTSPAMNQLLFS